MLNSNKSSTAPCRLHYSNSHSLTVLLGQLYLFNPPGLIPLNILILHSSTFWFVFFFKSGCCVIFVQTTDRKFWHLWWSIPTKLVLSSTTNTEPQAWKGLFLLMPPTLTTSASSVHNWLGPLPVIKLFLVTFPRAKVKPTCLEFPEASLPYWDGPCH